MREKDKTDRDLFSKYTNNSYSSTFKLKKKTQQLENKQNI